MTPPYYIVPPTQLFRNWKLLSELSEAFRGLGCLPDWGIFPEKTIAGVLVIECLQERETHTAYVTAWKNTEDHFVIYFISLYKKLNDNSCFVRQFTGFSAYYNYCEVQLHDAVKADYSRQLQYESYLSIAETPQKAWKKLK